MKSPDLGLTRPAHFILSFSRSISFSISSSRRNTAFSSSRLSLGAEAREGQHLNGTHCLKTSQLFTNYHTDMHRIISILLGYQQHGGIEFLIRIKLNPFLYISITNYTLTMELTWCFFQYWKILGRSGTLGAGGLLG